MPQVHLVRRPRAVWQPCVRHCLTLWFIAALLIPIAMSPAAATAQENPSGDRLASSQGEISAASPTAEELKRLADNLDRIKNMIDVVKPTIHDEDFERLDDIVDYSQKFAVLAAAIRQDLEEKRDVSSASSHTVETLGAIGLDVYTEPQQLQDLAELGLISKTAARNFGFLSFGAGDVAGALGTMVGQGRLSDVDAVTKGLDGASATAWGVVGYLVSGDWDVAQAFASGSRLATMSLRDIWLPTFEAITAKTTGYDNKIVALWEDQQQQRIASGRSPISIQQFYGWDGTILNRVDPGKLANANAEFGLPNPVQPVIEPDHIRREHYREVCIRGNCTRTELLIGASDRAAQPVGGIRLDAPVSGAALRGVTIDPATGNIIILADRDFLTRGLKLRDLAMALWLEFGPEPQDPQFSLDPADPKNPERPWLRAVYIPQTLQGRSMGAELFNGDLRLKELAFQTTLTPQGKLVEWKSGVPGFSSYAQLAMDNPGSSTGHAQFARWWIVTDRVIAKRAGDTLIFDARMAVKARRQVPDPSSPTGLRDIDTAPDSLEAQWARQLTSRYDALADESPALARVRELAKAVAIAKSLKTAGVQVDLPRIATILNGDKTPTIAKINAFSVSWQREQRTPFRERNREGVRITRHELHLFGGVDLSTVQPLAISDDGSARAVSEAAKGAFHMARPGTKVVHFEYQHAPLVAGELPLLLRKGS